MVSESHVVKGIRGIKGRIRRVNTVIGTAIAVCRPITRGVPAVAGADGGQGNCCHGHRQDVVTAEQKSLSKDERSSDSLVLNQNVLRTDYNASNREEQKNTHHATSDGSVWCCLFCLFYISN